MRIRTWQALTIVTLVVTSFNFFWCYQLREGAHELWEYQYSRPCNQERYVTREEFLKKLHDIIRDNNYVIELNNDRYNDMSNKITTLIDKCVDTSKHVDILRELVLVKCQEIMADMFIELRLEMLQKGKI